ncbi:conserved hypothetical protein [Microsporum canis CBS 113480]|uniref:Uncharacterized protein n=1 Tax=Arthroderma otae (strain ATCC MYA-4605 / CBS 113480) TaxID=554155 RepID=C5FRN4_ARTOC|nr:conserved hypothetical protein [Microsporum canis CBS 113480]EEQ32537.1 conserved hypothetical protein [Microsporum canis CBS 113480]
MYIICSSLTDIIPSANRGIGLGLSQKFYEEGWLKRWATNIFEIGYRVEASISGAAEQYGPGPLDCLVNCAGENISIFPFTQAMFMTYESSLLTEWFQIMVIGPYLATKYFQKSLEASSAGKIVNISSILGSISCKTHDLGVVVLTELTEAVTSTGEKFGYRLVKATLNQQTRIIAMVFKEDEINITMMSIHPGPVPTLLSRLQERISIDMQLSSEVWFVL